MITLRIGNAMETITHERSHNEKVKVRARLIQTFLYPAS